MGAGQDNEGNVIHALAFQDSAFVQKVTGQGQVSWEYSYPGAAAQGSILGFGDEVLIRGRLLGPGGILTVKLWTLSPAEAIEALIGNVEALVTDGTLSEGQGTSLTSKLDNAIKLLTDRSEQNDIAAMNIIVAFINEVKGYINGGNLTRAQGQPLIDVANAIFGLILNG